MPTASNKSSNPFISILIIALGLIVGYFYYAQISADASAGVPVPASLQDQQFLKFKDLRFDFSIFTTDAFTALRPVGEFPLDAGATGKQDLFGAY